MSVIDCLAKWGWPDVSYAVMINEYILFTIFFSKCYLDPRSRRKKHVITQFKYMPMESKEIFHHRTDFGWWNS